MTYVMRPMIQEQDYELTHLFLSATEVLLGKPVFVTLCNVGVRFEPWNSNLQTLQVESLKARVDVFHCSAVLES